MFENSYPSKSHSPFLITEALVPRVIRLVTRSVGRYYFNADFFGFFLGGGGEPIVRSLIIIVIESSDTDTTTKLYAAKFNPKKSYTIMSNS